MVPDQATKQGRRSHIELFWPANNSCTSGPSIFLCGMVCIFVVRQSWFQFWGSASEPSVTFCSFISQALRTFTHSVQFFTGDASEKMYTLFTPGIFSPLCTHRSRSASHPQNRTPSPAAAVKKHFVWLMINVVVNQNKHNVDFQLSIFVVHSPMARWPFLPYLTAALKCWLGTA